MDFRETVRMMQAVMTVLFEDDWRQLNDMSDLAEARWESTRVVLGTYQLGDIPVLSVKCGLLKLMPQHPDLSRHIHGMNPKMFFGRLQLHWGADGTHAVTCEHFMATNRTPALDAPGLQTIVDTVQYVVERSEYLLPGLRTEFGGMLFEDEHDGLAVVACG